MNIQGVFRHCLDKVFPVDTDWKNDYRSSSALRGERFSLQFVYRAENGMPVDILFEINSPLKKYCKLRKVELVPARYLATENLAGPAVPDLKPGLYPDPLLDINGKFRKTHNTWHALWIDVDIPKSCKPGKYTIELTCNISDRWKPDEKPSVTRKFTLEVIDAVLPEQTLIHTEWFHADCIASYYKIPVWSEEHWRIIENHFRAATSHGINMILTPVFTPPLDTAVGGERPTVQLVDVTLKNGKYSFDFTRLTKWIDLAFACGYKYIEISHLFTQWGAAFCPKIIANVNGKEKRIFGWDVKADSKKYRDFLDAFLPELTAYLKKKKLQNITYFHCSDEPVTAQLEGYSKAVKILRKHLEGFRICDALSHTDFYEQGLVTLPIPCEDNLDLFANLNVKPLWTYYCCGQLNKVPNRLFCMPSSRNRVLGMILYRYGVEGFLQWGFNFYHSQYSIRTIDPWANTDADEGFPAGDSFMVYPGEDGAAISSLKLEVMFQGMQDLRALQLLETYIGRQKIEAMLDKASNGKMSMHSYPQTAKELLALRSKINTLIKQHCIGK
jgi:hypothetical protein